MTSSQYTTPNSDFRNQDPNIAGINAAIHDRLQNRIDQLESRTSLLTGVLTGTAIALFGLLGWSIYQSIQQAQLAERQATLMAVTEDSVDLARLQSLDSNLQKLEQRVPEGTAALLEQNKAELASLKSQLAQVQATAQSAEAQADNQGASSADADRVAALSEQIQSLNQTIGSLQSKVDAQATQLTQLQATPAAAPAAPAASAAPESN